MFRTIATALGLFVATGASAQIQMEDIVPGLVNPEFVAEYVSAKGVEGLKIKFEYRSCSSKQFRGDLEADTVTVYMPFPQMECYGPTRLIEYTIDVADQYAGSLDDLVLANPVIEDQGGWGI